MVFSIEQWALEQELLIIDPRQLRRAAQRYEAGETLVVRSEFPISGPLPARILPNNDEKEYDVLVTLRTRGREGAARLAPQILTLGVGFNGPAGAADLEQAFALLLAKGSYCGDAVRRIAVLDANVAARGLAEFAAGLGVPVQGYGYGQLGTVKSGVSYMGKRAKTNVHYVCEAAAALDARGRVVVQKHAANGISMALAAPPFTLGFGAAASV